MDKINIEVVIYTIIIVVLIIICCHRPIDKAIDIHNEVATVVDKGIKNNGDNSKYLVYCKDSNGKTRVYEITDSLIMGRFDSSDTYAGIEVGKTYKFEVGGDRNEFMSWYPNIYKYEEVK